MTAATWRMVGSAGTLEAVASLLVERWGWSGVEPVATDDPNVWQVRHVRGIADGMRIRRHGRRYRLEILP